MSSPGTLRFAELSIKPPPPPAGYLLLYTKTDDILYIQNSGGSEFPLVAVTAITSLTGEATGTGPGATTVTLSNSAVIGKVLTGFTPGPNSPIVATDTILQAFEKLQAQTTAVSPMTTLGDIIYEDATPTPVRLPGNTSTTKQFLSQTGNGTISAPPVWSALASNNIPAINLATSGNGGVTGILPIANGGTSQTTAATARGPSGLNIDERSAFSNAPYTVLSTDRYVAQTGTMTATRVVTLPLANSVNAGQMLIIEDESGTVSNTNALTITASGGDLINGLSTVILRTPYGGIRFISNGSNAWFNDVVGVARGGTGIIQLPSDGQILIGQTSTNGYVLNTLTAGTGISITNGAGSITIAGNSTSPTTTKTANYTILSTDSIIFVDTTGGAFTLTLPDPSTLAGKIYRIIDVGGVLQSNNLTLARHASEKIEGLAASKLLQTSWGGWQVITNATDWYLI